MKPLAFICLCVILCCISILGLYLLVGAIIFKIFFSRKSVYSRVMRKDIERRIKENKIDLCWWEKVKLEKVQVTSFDGLKLVGHYLNEDSSKTVIIFHGFGGSYLEMQPYCQFFSEKNFNVLAVDARAHGESEGNCVGFGWLDRLDVLEWVKFVNQKTPNSKILLFGLSMGGATVCMASGEKGLKNVVGIISDCAYDNANRQIDFLLQTRKHLKIFKKHLYSYAKRLYGLDLIEADATKQVKKTEVPILYIHGGADDFVPPDNMRNLYNSTPQNKRDFFVIDEAGHGLAYAVGGVLYEKKVMDFLKTRTPLY